MASCPDMRSDCAAHIMQPRILANDTWNQLYLPAKCTNLWQFNHGDGDLAAHLRPILLT